MKYSQLTDIIIHINLYRQERQRYYSNRQRDVEKPREVLSIIIDGIDQNKTNVLHMIRTPKTCQNLWSLRTHLTGNLVHGRADFWPFSRPSHDCNLTITTLLITLLELGQKDGVIPPRLLLEFDNCVRENKNKYVMGFMAWLVKMKIFTDVKYSVYSILCCKAK